MGRKSLIAVLALIVCVSSAQSQRLSAVLSVAARPDPYLANWAQRRSTATITVTNATGGGVQGKFKVTVSKDGADVARTKTEQMSIVTFPIGISQWNAETMMPMQNVTFLGSSKTTAERTGQLPAGNYNFCVDILDPTGQTSLIGTQVCRPFYLTSYQVPILLQPLDQSTVQRNERPTMRWTPVSPTPPYTVRYQVLVFEVLPGQQPMQAYRGNQPIARRDVRGQTQWLWPLDIELPGRVDQYIWTVRAFDDHDNPLGDPDGYAQPFTFRMAPAVMLNPGGAGGRVMLSPGAGNAGARNAGGENPGGQGARQANPPPPPPGGGVMLGGMMQAADPHIVDFGAGNPAAPPSTCSNFPNVPAVTNTTPSPKTAAQFVDSFVTIGLFKMKVLTASGSASALAGTGSILVSWLMTPIAVQFDSIKINTGDTVFSGAAITQLDATPDPVSTQWATNIAGNIPWTKTMVKKLNTWLHANFPKLTNNLNLNTQIANATNTPVKLPLGINNAKGYTVAVTEIKFTKDGAQMGAVAAFPVPDANDTLGFKATNIPCSPAGPKATQGKLGLLEDQVITGNVNPNNTYVITIKAMDTTTGTFVEWDCSGFRQMQVKIDVQYPRSWLVPQPDPGPNGRVHTVLSTIITDWNDWIINATLDPCTIAHTNGAELAVSNMAYDHSDVRNPTGIVFPANFTGDNGLTFRGFYLKSGSVKLSDKLRSYDNPNQKITIGASNLIINASGITGKIYAYNILNFPKLNVANLGASIDTARIILLNSSLTEAAILGKIVLPVSDTAESNAIKYKALFSSDSGFTFALYPSGPIEANLWNHATLTLAPTCAFIFKINGGTSFSCDLSGDFEWSHINIGPVHDVVLGVGFEDLSIGYDVSANKFDFDPGTWKFASPQKSVHKFPVTIDDIKWKALTKQPGEVLRGALAFALIVNLDEGRIGGKTSMEVTGSVTKVNGKFVPHYQSVKLDSISIYAHLSAVALDGSLKIYSGNPTYGDGYAGVVKATFNSVKLSIYSRLQFGSTTYNNGSTPYRYWFVDAKVTLPPTAGIPIFTGFALYGGGLGAWRHMNVNNFPQPNVSAVANATSQVTDTVSGATYTPDNTQAFGFKVVGVMGTYPTPRTFNGDLTFAGQFAQGGGLTYIGIGLDFYAAAELTERSTAPVHGNANIVYTPPNKLFDMSAVANFKYLPANGDIIRGENIWLHLRVDGMTNKWYFKLGEPNHLNTTVVYNAITSEEYLMFGNDINPPTGFLPVTNSGLSYVGINPGWSQVSPSHQALSGVGFAFGVAVHAESGQRNLPLWGRVSIQYNAGGGFEVDASLLKYANNVSCGNTSPIGFRGWYVRTDAAAWFYASCNLHVAEKTGTISDPCLFCCHHNHPNGCDYTLFDVKAGIWAHAGFPNPWWIAGRVHGHYDVLDGAVNGDFDAYFTAGTQCEPSTPPDPSQTYVQEDAAADQETTLIVSTDPINNQTGLYSDRTVRVMYGFTPSQAFDVQERQTDGSLRYRTFQARYTVTIDSVNHVSPPAGPVLANQNLNNSPDGGGNNHNQVSYINGTGRNHEIPPAPPPPGPAIPILLSRTGPNVMGQYEYYRVNPVNTPYSPTGPIPALQDSTRFRLTVNGSLWEFVNNQWVQARRRSNNQPIAANRISYFSTLRRMGPYVGSGNNNMQVH